MGSQLDKELKDFDKDKKKSQYELDVNKDIFTTHMLNGLGESIISELNKEYVEPTLKISIFNKIKRVIRKIKNVL